MERRLRFPKGSDDAGKEDFDVEPDMDVEGCSFDDDVAVDVTTVAVVVLILVG